jgi:hypothetical protein
MARRDGAGVRLSNGLRPMASICSG